MKFSMKYLAVTTLSTLLVLSMSTTSHAKEKRHFKVAWALYVGWLPLGYASDSGIVKKWGDKYNIDIEIIQFMDYIESINQYTSGDLDSVTLTNMDALGMPAVGGVDSTAIVLGDYSNGNDAIILKDADKLEQIKGRNVHLVEYSVSHYLLTRALQTVNMTERDVKLVNTSDSDMISGYQTEGMDALVSWNPTVSSVLQNKSANVVFDSSQIPGEIMDIVIVKTEVLRDNPNFAKAMAGIWYEASALLKADTPEGRLAREKMAEMAGTDEKGLQEQLAATHLFEDPGEAVNFFRSPDLGVTMEKVSDFLFENGLMGPEAKSADTMGIELPNGDLIGSRENIKLRFTDVFMQSAKDGSL